MKKRWWNDKIAYQIYPKSFCDSNGDGIGDIPGIISKLDYLKDLGVDIIWLSPVYKSPFVDQGYDIADYYAIGEEFGTMEEFDLLLAETKKRGMYLIMDLVVNHCSDQHVWFQKALADPESEEAGYFWFVKGENGAPPSNIRSYFGGSAWEPVPGTDKFYLHMFAKEQPDLNWENPKLRRELYDMIRFWVGKGVGGFRLDVIDQIAKDPELKVTGNGPRLHDFLRELSAEAFIEEGLVTVGEAWGADVERAKLYSAPDGSELSMVFQFQHMCLDQEGDKWDFLPLSLPALKACYKNWQQGLYGEGWNSLFLNNHDLPRIVSRWGNDSEEFRVRSAKMLATMLHGMQGTPYIYQGEELGMTNIRLPIEQYVDLEIQNMYAERTAAGYAHEDVMASIYARGRDNARTPIQWTAEEGAGFTTGSSWMPINKNHSFINAEEALADPDSVFYYYQKLIALRKQKRVFRDGWFELLMSEDEKVFAYTRDTDREHLLVVCNFTGETLPFELPGRFDGSQMILCNYSTSEPGLRPYEAAMLYYET